MQVKIESGELLINIYDLFSSLSEEEMEELESHWVWHSSIYKNLSQEMKDNLAGESWNENLFLLEKAFFTMSPEEKESEWDQENFRDGVFHTMKYAVKEILRENAKKRAEIYKHDCARSKVYNWMISKYGEDVAYEMHKIYNSELYGDPHAYSVSHTMADDIDLVGITEKWVDEMILLFNPKTE